MGQGSLKELAKTHGNIGLEWAEDARGKKMGQGFPRERNGPRKPASNIMGQESPSNMDVDSITILGHYNQVKEKAYIKPKRGPASMDQMTP